jgi:hypothetical protein
VLEGAVRDHVHVVPAAEQLRPLPGVHDHRVHLGREPKVDGLAPDHVVHGEHPWARGGQQVGVDPLDRKPLEVAHVRRGRPATVAQHVGHVLGQLHGAPPPRCAVAEAGREPVEGLAHAVSERRRRRAVHEAGRDQLHVHAATRQRPGQCVVVGDHVPRRVDQVHAHAGIL